MGASAKRVPTRQLPDWVVQIAAMRDSAVQQILPALGKIKNSTTLAQIENTPRYKLAQMSALMLA
jgi:hypothetical protein